MKAYGKEVIILTDKKSIIASDLKGKGVFPYINGDRSRILESVIDDWIQDVNRDIEGWKRFGDIAFEISKDYESGFELHKKAIMYGDSEDSLNTIKKHFSDCLT